MKERVRDCEGEEGGGGEGRERGWEGGKGRGGIPNPYHGKHAQMIITCC